MITTRLLTIIVCLTIIACKGASTEPAPLQPVDPTPDAIRDAAFRYLFTHKAGARDPNVKLFFLAFSEAIVPIPHSFVDSDPSDQFLSRFASNIPTVKKYSQCTIALEGVFDKQTNERGILFRVGPLTIIDSSHAEAQVGYFIGGLGGSGDILELQKSDSTWIVTNDIVRWIS